MDGLTIDGEPVGTDDASFNAMLQDAARESAQSPDSAPPADPSTSTADEISHALLDEKTSPAFSDGLIDISAEPAPSTEVDTEATIEGVPVREAWDALGVAAEKLESAEADLGERREADAIELFGQALDGAANLGQVAAALASLKADPSVSEESYEALLFDAATYVAENSEGAQFTEEGELAPTFIARVENDLDSQAEQLSAIRKAADAEQLTYDLLPAFAEQRVKEMKAAVAQWQGEAKIGKAEAIQRLREADALFRDAYGISLDALVHDPSVSTADFYDALVAADAAYHGAGRAERERLIQAAILGAGATSVDEGLTFDGRPNVHYELPGINDRTKELAAREASRPRLRTRDLSAAFTLGDTDVSKGFTENGKPASIDQVTKAKERLAAEKALERAVRGF